MDGDQFDLHEEGGDDVPLHDEALDAPGATLAQAAGRAGGALPRRRGRAVPGGVGSFEFPTDPPTADVRALFPSSDDMARPHVCSVIADVRLGPSRVVDLLKLATSVRNVEVCPARKTAVLRLREPRCAVAVRLCGVITISGCANVVAAKRAATIACKVVRRAMGWPVDELRTALFTINTATVRFDLKHPLRIDRLAALHTRETNYEPESFSGCTVRLTGTLSGSTRRWAATALVFASGRVVITGACTAQEVKCAYNGLLPYLANVSAAVPTRALAASRDDDADALTGDGGA
jgi:TATA-box binding protein (TBP) (component of TFIID and TFIIIB)